MRSKIINELAPSGVLRAGINTANILLVTGEKDNGEPSGVSPNLANEIALELGVEIKYISCETPGGTAETIKNNICDIVLIADEPARAEFISFTDAYVEIEATYIVPQNSPVKIISDVDQFQNRIAVSGTSAYDLYLSRTIKKASLCRGQGLPETAQLFLDEKLDALAGLRPALEENLERMSGMRILKDSFMTVEQAIGTHKTNSLGHEFLVDFITSAKSSGLISNLIKKYGVDGKLQVPK